MDSYSSFCYKYMSLFFNFFLPSAFEEFNIIFKSTKVSVHLLWRESVDNQISGSTSWWKCGFWDATEAVVDAVSRLEFQKVIGYYQTSRTGFGSFKTPSTPWKNSHECRRLVSDLVHEVNENACKAKLYISICRTAGLNGAISENCSSLEKHCWQCSPLWSQYV